MSELMADFRNPDPSTMNFKELAKKAKMLKETEGGKEKMCAITQKWYNDGRAEGIAVGEARGKAEAAKSLIKSNVPVIAIMQATGLSMEKLQEMSQHVGVALVM